MRVIILFSVILAVVNGEYGNENKLENGTRLYLANDITYHFYSQKNPSHSVKVRINTTILLEKSNFKSRKDTLFIIHGWKSHNESSVNYIIRESILAQQDINVFVVDWSAMAGKNYISAKNSVLRVGQYVAGFISELKSEFGLKLAKVKFVGHSLGAHVCGNAGAALHGQVDRIVGLDPAGPMFTKGNTGNRLDPTDAKFVQVIHTNGGQLGFGSPSGHADYFPNGGESQPGCGLDLGGGCAHSRVYDFYAESLSSDGFIAKRCSSYSDYKKGRCDDGDVSVMGRFNSDYSARGNYYLTTNSNPPYARG